MKLVPESKTISEIFPIEPINTYRIPIYQRNYSWGTENIDDLFSDILTEDKGYYIGNFLVTEESDSTNTKVFSIVDGQQRITTIALFLLALHDRLDDLKTEMEVKHSEAAEGESLTENEDFVNLIGLQKDLKRKLLVDNKVPHLVLLESDREIFENYLGSLRKEKRGKYGNRRFAKRFKYISDLMKDNLTNYYECNNFYQRLNSLELLRITVENISDAFSVFSSLNAKGVPLTLIDLLKSNYLGKATQQSIGEQEALERWENLIKIFLDSNGDPNSTAITQFFLNNYDTFINDSTSSITKKSALNKYEKHFNNQGYQYIYELTQNGKIYSLISPFVEPQLEHSFSPETIDALNKLKKLEASQLYPLELFLIKKCLQNQLNKDVLLDCLVYLKNYYVRRNIIQKPKSSNIRAKVLQAVRKLENSINLNEEALSIIKQNLNSISASDLDFESALKGSVYDISPSTVRLMLIELERKMHNSRMFNKQHPDNLDDLNSSNQYRWTLEHILPKTENLSQEWKTMISSEDMDDVLKLQLQNVHRIGNLTLTGYNSEMSTKSFIRKRDYSPSDDSYEIYTGLRTKLFINESILDEGIEIENKDEWTIEDIDRRTDVLVSHLKDMYPIF